MPQTHGARTIARCHNIPGQRPGPRGHDAKTSLSRAARGFRLYARQPGLGRGADDQVSRGPRGQRDHPAFVARAGAGGLAVASGDRTCGRHAGSGAYPRARGGQFLFHVPAAAGGQRRAYPDLPHDLSADGKFSWEEVECLGACANAPMAQIGKDYYEDLTAERFAEMLDEMAAGKVPVPGPQNGRFASEPLSGLTTLSDFDSGKTRYNASVQRATDLGDTIKRIDGEEVPLLTPWKDRGANHQPAAPTVAQAAEPVAPVDRSKGQPADKTGVTKAEAPATSKAKPAPKPKADKPAKAKTKSKAKPEETTGTRPEALKAPRGGDADDLKMIKGVGPKLEQLLQGLGFYHFDQVAAWTADEVAWVDQNLEGFKGRVSRDSWVDQARVLAQGGTTEFSKKVKKGDVY